MIGLYDGNGMRKFGNHCSREIRQIQTTQVLTCDGKGQVLAPGPHIHHNLLDLTLGETGHIPPQVADQPGRDGYVGQWTSSSNSFADQASTR